LIGRRRPASGSSAGRGLVTHAHRAGFAPSWHSTCAPDGHVVFTPNALVCSAPAALPMQLPAPTGTLSVEGVVKRSPQARPVQW